MIRFACWFIVLLPTLALAKQEALVFDDHLLNVSFDNKQPVTFVGKKSLDATGGGSAPILYPADTAGLFLVSILTHAAISGGVQKAQLNKEQEEANKVLEAYSSYISTVNEAFLLEHTYVRDAFPLPDKQLQCLLGDKHLKNSRWQVNVVPVFAMTQNQSSFLIYNKLTFVDRALTPKEKRKLKKVKKGQPNPNEKLVVIISDPVLVDDKADFWLRENGQAFNNAVKELYVESLHIGMARHFGSFKNTDTKQITIKYLENGVKKIERGYVISQSCQRTVFESLAGEIKSVPNLEFSSCTSV